MYRDKGKGPVRILPFVIIMAAGCQGGVNPVGPPTGRTISYSQEVQPIYDAHCTSCHAAGGFGSTFGGGSMVLTSGQSHATTVDQASAQRPDLFLIRPGDSANSLIYLKVSQNSPPSGETMPLFGDRLSSTELAILRDWIDQGAANN